MQSRHDLVYSIWIVFLGLQRDCRGYMQRQSYYLGIDDDVPAVEVDWPAVDPGNPKVIPCKLLR